jgi:hypothetical protein
MFSCAIAFWNRSLGYLGVLGGGSENAGKCLINDLHFKALNVLQFLEYFRKQVLPGVYINKTIQLACLIPQPKAQRKG